MNVLSMSMSMASSPTPTLHNYKPNRSSTQTLDLLFSKSEARASNEVGMGMAVRPTKTITKLLLMLQMCRKCVEEVKQLHAQSVVSGCLHQIAGRLIQSYVSVSRIGPPLDHLYGNTAVSIPIGRSCPQMETSLLLFHELLLAGFFPDSYAYTFVLQACSSLKALSEGKQIHGRMIKVGMGPGRIHTVPYSTLVHMYANSGDTVCAERVQISSDFPQEHFIILRNSMISRSFNQGCVDLAGALFSEMRERDVASWSGMVTGYSKNGLYLKALHAFGEMLLLSQLVPNESTLVSALSACAHLGALHQGRRIHAYIHKLCGGVDEAGLSLGTALVNMYAKCGSMSCGYQVFREMSHKDVIAWGTIISGFAIHGQPQKCFQLFDEMLDNGIRPSAVIFVAILSACRHAGYVKLGQHYFYRMIHEFGVKPSIAHYGCMVDLFSRAGRLRDAENVITSMPEEPNSTIWGAFLSACRTHRDLARGKRALGHLIDLEPTSGDRYKLAGHVFAAAGKIPEAAKLRKIINENGLPTTCGSSFIELDGIIHEFSSGNI